MSGERPSVSSSIIFFPSHCIQSEFCRFFFLFSKTRPTSKYGCRSKSLEKICPSRSCCPRSKELLQDERPRVSSSIIFFSSHRDLFFASQFFSFNREEKYLKFFELWYKNNNQWSRFGSLPLVRSKQDRWSDAIGVKIMLERFFNILHLYTWICAEYWFSRCCKFGEAHKFSQAWEPKQLQHLGTIQQPVLRKI